MQHAVPMSATIEELATLPLFREFSENELSQFAHCFTATSLSAGQSLYREGDLAKSASLLLSGQLDAFTALPGGGEILVGNLSCGSLIGEMALLAEGYRTATVRAKSDAQVLTISSRSFQAALDQSNVSAFKVLRQVTRILSERLRLLRDKISGVWENEAQQWRETLPGNEEIPLQAFPGNQFRAELRPFLPALPFFQRFEAAQIDRLLELVQPFRVAVETSLHREGSPAKACYIVVRGAVEHSLRRGPRHALEVLGPGRVCGENALILQRDHPSDAIARTEAVLLRLKGADFEHLFNGETAESLEFQRALSVNQLLTLKSANNLFTTLASHAQIREHARILLP